MRRRVRLLPVAGFWGAPRAAVPTTVVAAVVWAFVAGCGIPASGGPEPVATLGGGVLVSQGHGWRGAHVLGPLPAPGTCHFGHSAGAGGPGGPAMPDRACTPGAVDGAVTASNLGQTLCRKGGYTDSVRPPREVTDVFKTVARQAYSAPGGSSDYELDHLVPLGLGGSSDSRNLWPELNAGDPGQFDHSRPSGTNAKDGVESRLHEAVCSGEVGLAAAQEAIAMDWPTAMARLGVSP
jgi:hypothetical protein